MEVDEETYSNIMRELRLRLPDIAAQIDDEVSRGRAVTGSQLSTEYRNYRSANLKAAGVQALNTADVAVFRYASEERMELMCYALITLAETMYASRSELHKFTAAFFVDDEDVVFEPPEGGESEFVSLPEEAQAAAAAVWQVRELLNPWLEERLGEQA